MPQDAPTVGSAMVFAILSATYHLHAILMRVTATSLMNLDP